VEKPGVFGFTFACTRLPSITIESASMLRACIRFLKSFQRISFCPLIDELKARMSSAKISAAMTQLNT